MLRHYETGFRHKRAPKVSLERQEAHHLLGYTNTAGVNDVDVFLAAIADPTFQRRTGGATNSAFVFTEPWDIIWAAYLAASALECEMRSAIWNGIIRQEIWPINRAATPPSDPRVMDWRMRPQSIPMNDFLELVESNNLGAATEQGFGIVCIAPPGWNRNLPAGVPLGTIRAAVHTARFAATTVVSANAWSADVPIVFTDAMRTGTYAVVGCEIANAGVIAFRLNFPRMPYINGRKLFPGNLASTAVGNQIPRWDRLPFGEWGRFTTLELPSISCLEITGGDTAIVGRMDLIYLGESTDL